ncbi:MAG TPA: hypothetical protein VL371_04730 [Gemmataceae bacterium]|jgi:hypothetical protein|nr:hypothetical protein [Gemmataceae bacterium]
MAAIIPARFLFRVAHPCRYLKKMPRTSGERLVDLPESCRLENFAAIDARKNFADVRLAWNENGIGLQVTVSGKDDDPRGDAADAKHSDGVTLWLDTRDARTSHRASRYCHQFAFLPTGGGPDRDEPVFVQSKIHRALQDAPIASAAAVPFRSARLKSGYRIEGFLSSAVLAGYDPDEHPRLGIYYAVRDSELGEQVLSVGPEFPYAEDPSLWGVLELVK